MLSIIKKGVLMKIKILSMLCLCLSLYIFTAQIKNNAYSQAVNKINEYFQNYQDNDHGSFARFLKEELAAYPIADNERAYISNPDAQGD